MAEPVVARQVKDRTLGKNWVTRFLRRHPGLAVKLGTRLDHQSVFASDPVLLKHYCSKVLFILITGFNSYKVYH